MEKASLRSVIRGLEVDQVVTINFHSSVEHVSGDYRVEKKRKGRGKGGSLLAEVTLATNDSEDESREIVVIGTPKNDEVLNMVVNGDMHGYETEKDIPVFYDTDETQATVLKKSFKRFLSDDVEFPVETTVESTAPEFNGTFNVNGARQLRGRGGQVVLSTVEGTELWSYRHSGVIQSFTADLPVEPEPEVVEAPEPVVEEAVAEEVTEATAE